jgi:hypothetical protein
MHYGILGDKPPSFQYTPNMFYNDPVVNLLYAKTARAHLRLYKIERPAGKI